MTTKYTTHLGDITADNFEQVLFSISYFQNHQCELVFPARMIESICKEKQCPCYKFAHNLEGDHYMRARLSKITLEFLVRNNQENQNEKESLVLQITSNGNMLYRKPENPNATIYVN